MGPVSGVSCYFGITLSGKTTLAIEHLSRDMNQDGRPALVLDCMPARNLRAYPHAQTLDQVVDLLYGRPATATEPARPRKSAFYTPKNEGELEKLMSAVHAAGIAGGPVHVLWDEASLHQSPQHIADGVGQALRGWQHNDCSFRIVTQRPADLNGVIFATMPEVFCFRLERQADLERVRDELRLNPDEIEHLNQGEHQVYSRDRFKTIKEQSDGRRAGHPEDLRTDADPVHADRVLEPAPSVPRPLPQDLGGGGNVPPSGSGQVPGGAEQKP
jgi:hypothetical protein